MRVAIEEKYCLDTVELWAMAAIHLEENDFDLELSKR